jgi:hypothetical protein
MGDESKIRDAADAVKGLLEAAPIYDDALQPVAKQIGKALETLGRAVNMALAPIAALVWGYEKIGEYLVPALEERLARVPTENIITPSPTVAGPAIEALRFAGHDETLRDLYANLLATAMNSETAYRAHPAFVEIIKQLTPDEAKLIAFIARLPVIELAFINVRAALVPTEAESYRGGQDVLRRFVTLGDRAECAFSELTSSYLDNFERLGLIEIQEGSYWTGAAGDKVYEELQEAPRVQEALARIEAAEERKPEIHRGLIRITSLGRQFIEAAVVDRSASAPVATSEA